MGLMQCTDTKAQQKVLEYALDEKYRQRNRYSDILPFEHTRPKLSQRPQTEGKGDPEEVQAYINANFVDGPLKQGDQKLIAAQGPLP